MDWSKKIIIISADFIKPTPKGLSSHHRDFQYKLISNKTKEEIWEYIEHNIIDEDDFDDDDSEEEEENDNQ